jgi:hypothetical protein
VGDDDDDDEIWAESSLLSTDFYSGSIDSEREATSFAFYERRGFS